MSGPYTRDSLPALPPGFVLAPDVETGGEWTRSAPRPVTRSAAGDGATRNGGLPPLPPGFVLQDREPIRAQLDDGRILEFPAGTSPATIQDAVAKAMADGVNPGDAAAIGAGAATPHGGIRDLILNDGKQTPQQQPAGIVANIGAGASQGVYGDLLGQPAELANLALKQIGLGSERPLGGTEDMRSVSDYIATIPNRIGAAVEQGSLDPLVTGRSQRVVPVTEGERIAFAGGRAAGNAAGTMMGGQVLAAASNPGGMANAIGSALRAQPVNQIVSSATGGAVGEATGNPWLGLAAGLGTSAAMNVGSNAVAGITAPFRETGRQQIVGGTLARFADQNADDLARQLALRGDDPLPGSVRTTAEASRNAGLANIERGMRNDPQAAATFYNADQARLAARDARVATMGQGMDAPTAGGVIRNSFDDAYGAARQTTNRAYDAVRNSQAAIDPQDAYTAGAKSLQKYFGPGAGDPPPELAQMLGDLRSGNVPLPMLERIMQRASAFARQSTDPRAQAVAKDIRTAVNSSLQSAAEKGLMPAEDAAAVLAARSARAEQGQVFENQFTGRLSGRTPRGSTSAPLMDSEIPSQFFGASKTTPDKIRALGRALWDNPEGMDALREYGIGEFRRTAYNARGELQAEAARRWMRDNHAGINAVPGLRDVLERTMRPVLADADSARFARDAGRAVGSNTVQNTMTATAMDKITGVPLSSIPGVESVYASTVGRIGKLAGTDDALREAMMRALLDPDYAANALRMSDEAGYNSVPLLRALNVPIGGVSAYGIRDALDGPNKARQRAPR